MYAGWRDWSGDDEGATEAMAEVDEIHMVAERVTDAIKAGRQQGTALLVMVTQESGGDLTEPLMTERIREGDLVELRIYDRHTASGVEVPDGLDAGRFQQGGGVLCHAVPRRRILRAPQPRDPVRRHRVAAERWLQRVRPELGRERFSSRRSRRSCRMRQSRRALRIWRRWRASRWSVCPVCARRCRALEPRCPPSRWRSKSIRRCRIYQAADDRQGELRISTAWRFRSAGLNDLSGAGGAEAGSGAHAAESRSRSGKGESRGEDSAVKLVRVRSAAT